MIKLLTKIMIKDLPLVSHTMVKIQIKNKNIVKINKILRIIFKR